MIDDYILQRKRHDAVINLENTVINSAKASLNLFYVRHNEYPLNWEKLVSDFKEENNSTEIIDSIDTRLKNFEYKVRGDNQAAQIKYINYDGEEKVVEFSYKDDFH